MAKSKPKSKPKAASAVPPPDGRPSLWRALTPKVLLDSTPAEWLFGRDVETRHIVLLVVLAAAVFLPYLGAVGFWDPWEPHYGEVARSMIARQDYVHPYWECAYFFSKPVLPMWLMTIGMHLAGINDPARGISVSTEWWVRSTFVVVTIFGVVFAYLGVARTLSRRAAVWTSVVLITSPMFFLLARQLMPDMPLMALVVASIACLMIGLFEKETVQDGWLYGAYAFAGVATLAKGLLGLALPALAMFGYLLLSGDWWLLKRMRVVTGALVTLAMMAPWYVTMGFFDGKNPRSMTWFQEFIIHDHLKRLGFDPTTGKFINGVYTTNPVTSWVYYLRELGYSMFPWVALLPGVLANVLRPALPAPRTRRQRAKLFVVAWLITSFAIFAFAATKYHHYCFPCLPPLAILIALHIEDLLENGVQGQVIALFVGGILFAMIAQDLTIYPSRLVNLFVFKYDRPYPLAQMTPAVAAFPWHAGLAAMTQWVSDLLFANVRRTFSFLFVVTPLVVVAGAFVKGKGQKKEHPHDRLWVVGALSILAVVFAVYLSSYNWRKLSPHWSQRDLFWTYDHESLPTEPIGAYLMNWRGETFYSRNTVRQLQTAEDLRSFVALPGRDWILVEWYRLAGMKATLGPGYRVREIDHTNNKFALVTVEHRAG